MKIDTAEMAMLNFLLQNKQPGAISVEDFLAKALHALRLQLGVETAFVSEVVDGMRLRHVDSSRETCNIQPGRRDPLDDPTQPTVPLALSDGRVVGTLTCSNGFKKSNLSDRDMRVMRVYAAILAEHLDAGHEADAIREALITRIDSAISGDGVSFVYQPVFDVDYETIVGFEAFARFAQSTSGPDTWFSDAARVGLDVELGTAVLSKAFENFARFPAAGYVAFNVTPNMVLSGKLQQALARAPLERIVLEIKEHLGFRDYDEMAKALAPLRKGGLRVSLDTAGGGLASFRHIVGLRPDIIKLDMNLVRGIDTDSARRALAAGMVQFAADQGCEIVAEGVETAAELECLKTLGVSKMQGYFLGRPLALDSATSLCVTDRKTREVAVLDMSPRLLACAA